MPRVKSPRSNRVMDALLASPTFADLKPADVPADPPETVAISKELLVIEERYQRTLDTRASVRLIRHMVEHWSWSEYSPLIVAPRNDGTWAVIDGAHRTAAAWLIPSIDGLPCMVVRSGSVSEEARAFVGHNTNRVAMTRLHLHHAMVAAGDPDASALAELCSRAGVCIPPGPRPAKNLRPGETLALATIAKIHRRFGDDVAVKALRILSQAYKTRSGQITAQMIEGVSMLLERRGVDTYPFKSLVEVVAEKDARAHQALGARISGYEATTASGIYLALLKRLDPNALQQPKKVST